MKKQKAPIFPILIVIILLGWIGYSSLPKGRNIAPPPTDQPKENAKDVGNDVSKTMKADDKSKPDTEAKGPKRRIEISSLLKPDVAAMKPKPSNTSTASQWYEKDSAPIGGQ